MPPADSPFHRLLSLPARIANRLQAGRWLRELRRCAAPLAPLDVSPLLVIVPHQDDESFGCGGLIALKRRCGAPVVIVYLTDGAASLLPGAVRGEDLVQRRRAEAIAAGGILGVPRESIHFLDGPDGGLAALDAHRKNQLVGRLAALLADLKPGQVAVTFRHDVHADHEAAYHLAEMAVRLTASAPEILEFPIWSLWHMRAENRPWAGSAAWRRLDIRAVRETKLRAVACFASQLSPSLLGKRGYLPPLLVRRLTGAAEIFFVTRHPGGGPHSG